MANSSSSSEPKKRKKLPGVGNKINRSINPDREKHEIREFLDEHKRYLQDQRIVSSESLIKAQWDPLYNEAKVTKNRGSSLNVFGHSKNRFIYLYPEEALYLIEMNNLELYYNDVRLSIQRSYSLLVNSKTNVTINQYRVFKHFSTLGYKVFRHVDTSKVELHEPSAPSQNQEETRISPYGEFCKTLQIFNPIVEDEIHLELPKIIYDVYLPQSSFPKSNRPIPDYYLSVMNLDDDITGLLQFLTITNYTNVLFASVSDNSVSVFNVKGVQIPELL